MYNTHVKSKENITDVLQKISTVLNTNWVITSGQKDSN